MPGPAGQRCAFEGHRVERRPPVLGFGLGLRPKHYSEILGRWPKVDWFEVITENFLVPGGRPRRVLAEVRAHYPVVLHGVSLSIGSTDPLDFGYLRQVRDLIRWLEPAWVSDHLCWTGVDGMNFHDLLPLPFTEEALRHVCERVAIVQDVLGQRIALENVSSYLAFTHSTLSEWDFLRAVSEEADCHILLDINNVFVSARNHGFDPYEYLQAVPAERVVQFHLAGFADRGTFLHDTHDHPIAAEVWKLYRAAVRRFAPVAVSIERDDRIPPLAELLLEVEQARAVAYEAWHEHAAVVA